MAEVRPRAAAAEARAPRTDNPVGGRDLPHIPRKWRDDAIKVLHDGGYAVSGDHAYRLLRDWQRWRRVDAEKFIAAEFAEFVRRRGDLIQVRGPRRHEWRVSG